MQHKLKGYGLFLVLALMALPVVAANGELVLPAKGRFILPAVSAPEVFKQCSREVPKKIDGYWDPKPADVRKLEGRLKPFLESQKASHVPLPGVYNRQYAGFRQNGVFYIYGNFYPALSQAKLKNQNTIAVIVCDGGPLFWSIVYRVDTGQFQTPTFNGSTAKNCSG